MEFLFDLPIPLPIHPSVPIKSCLYLSMFARFTPASSHIPATHTYNWDLPLPVRQ